MNQPCCEPYESAAMYLNSAPDSLAFFRRVAALVTTAAACLLPGSGHALPITQADEISVRAVVEGQLAAVASDDANKAFSFAAPNVREAVGTAPRFLAMVRSHYPAIYRPTSMSFFKAEGQDDNVVQRVQLLDEDGDAWLAVYTLQRQKDKVWRITGCKLALTKGRMA